MNWTASREKPNLINSFNSEVNHKVAL